MTSPLDLAIIALTLSVEQAANTSEAGECPCKPADVGVMSPLSPDSD